MGLYKWRGKCWFSAKTKHGTWAFEMPGLSSLHNVPQGWRNPVVSWVPPANPRKDRSQIWRTWTIIETGLCFPTKVLFHCVSFKFLFASVNLQKKWWGVADVWWLDWAADWNPSFSRLVSVAFVTIRWAGPVVDDQGNADQGKQHPQTQEQGSLEQQKAWVTSHLHLGKIAMLSPSFCVPLYLAFVTTIAELWESF